MISSVGVWGGTAHLLNVTHGDYGRNRLHERNVTGTEGLIYSSERCCKSFTAVVLLVDWCQRRI